ncbi:putative helicase [Tetrabaena socialis]|uniref:Putative helicase n=1 Tax=Tetrabaena socialis TaxID=47790 RepID=A0A2J7ZPD9_9CHLO|nr:putative helicase [Tetrabaena socialis]|eukprot:PNH02121.1 putative helicase [Tetrabaena socialis]
MGDIVLVKSYKTRRYARNGDPKDLNEFAQVLTAEALNARLSELSLNSEKTTDAEFLIDGKIVKIYLDYDESSDTEFTEEDVADRAAEVTRRLDLILDILRDINPHVSYVLAQRHGFDPVKRRHKISFRPFISGIRIKYTDIPRLFTLHPGLARAWYVSETSEETSEENSKQPFWDAGVYKAGGQMLGAIHCQKAEGDPRVLRPLSSERSELTRDHMAYVAQYVDPAWLLCTSDYLSELEDLSSSPASSATSSALPANTADSKCLDILSLLQCLGPGAAAYRDTWMKVALFLKAHVGESGFDGFVAFSRKDPEKFSGVKDCRKLWDSLNVSRPLAIGQRPLTVATLHWLAKRDDPDAYAAWSKQSKLKKTLNSKLTTQNNTTFSSEDVMTSAVSMLRSFGSPAFDSPAFDSIKQIHDAKVIDAGDGDTAIIRTTLEDGEEYRMSLRLKDLFGTLTKVSDGTIVKQQYMHGDHGIPIAPDLSSVHAGIKSGETWTTKRHCDNKVVFEADSTAIELINYNFPGEESAKVDFLKATLKAATVAQKSKLAFLKSAHDGAVGHAIRNQFGMGWAIINIVNNNTFTNDTAELARTPDFAFVSVLQSSGLLADIIAINERDVYTFHSESGLWILGSVNKAAMLIREAACTGVLKVNEIDAKYLQSCDGPVKVLRSMMSKFEDSKFPERLNKLPDGCLAFDNGMYNVRSNTLRPFARDDFISTTIGYSFQEEVDPELKEFVRHFYAQVLPIQEEREYFQQAIARALFAPKNQAKSFIILCDERDGSNGKTTLMRAVESVFGAYSALTERDFLYECTTSANAAAANFLSYIGKRLAFFDEPSSSDGALSKRLDIRRLKDLTSGDSRIRGRMLHSNDIVDARWEALIVIACNESNFPSIDATDAPFVRRMKALKMRTLFLPPEQYQQYLLNGDDVHVFPMGDEGFKERLNEHARMAHLHLLMSSFRTPTTSSEPACIAEMVDKIVLSSDPRVLKATEFLETYIDFNPVRAPEFSGKQYYAWLTQKDLLNRFWTWYSEDDSRDTREFRKHLDRSLDKKSSWKAVLQRAMEAKGRRVKQIQPVVGGVQITVLAFDRVS